MNENLGERIRKERINMRYSQSELAKALNVTSSAISAYELSERTPSVDTLTRLARIFNTSIDYLVNGEKYMPTHISLEGLQPYDVVAIRTLVISLRGRGKSYRQKV